jgi:hypothetical protein
MTDYEKVTDFSNLYKAFKKSKSGKGHKISSAKFNIMVLEGINLLKERLEDKSYQIAAYNEFKVYEPKERIIKAGAFQDKIVQHSLCDNVLIPIFQPEFIDDNYAGQIGKGTLFGLNRLSDHIFNFYCKYQTKGYILKCDITKFFYNIDHEILKDIIQYYISDNDIIWLCEKFIDSTNGVGIPLGNQISQVFALIYLNGLDHFIKSELSIEYYGRYMDDFYLIHQDKNYLKFCLNLIEQFVETLRLSLNNKTQIIPLKNGVDFLGFHTYVTEDGKIVRKLKNENKRNAQRKYIKMAKLVKLNKLSQEKFDESYNAWKNHTLHGNCYKLVSNMDAIINTQIKNENV